MSWFFTNLLSAFLLPPLSLLLITALGLALWRTRPFTARLLLITSFALLWLLSTPFFADSLLHHLEGDARAMNAQKQPADAIVLLGGGTYFQAPEYAGETVNAETLVRLRFAAKLYRETGKPILVSGGNPVGNATSEAAQMKQVLEQEFNVPVKWAEGASNNTLENARLTWQLLNASRIHRIFLVTHAWHMPRAVHAFQDAGFEVIPAPTAYTTRYHTDLLAFIPNADALRNSRIFMRELIGTGWYQLKSKL